MFARRNNIKSNPLFIPAAQTEERGKHNEICFYQRGDRNYSPICVEVWLTMCCLPHRPPTYSSTVSSSPPVGAEISCGEGRAALLILTSEGELPVWQRELALRPPPSARRPPPAGRGDIQQHSHTAFTMWLLKVQCVQMFG